MPYYPTLTEDVRRAKEILAKGKPEPICSRHCETPRRDPEQEHPGVCICGGYLIGAEGGTIYGADTYAAYRLLASLVEAIEAVDVKVCETALRVQRLAEGKR